MFLLFLMAIFICYMLQQASYAPKKNSSGNDRKIKVYDQLCLSWRNSFGSELGKSIKIMFHVGNEGVLFVDSLSVSKRLEFIRFPVSSMSFSFKSFIVKQKKKRLREKVSTRSMNFVILAVASGDCLNPASLSSA